MIDSHALRMSDSPRSASVAGRYRLVLASGAAQLRAAQSLRFMVFNLELHEGLAQSFENGLDADRFDAVCDHLLVEAIDTGQVVGTYRLQSGAAASRGHGYYSAREFDFGPYEILRAELVELGRACIDAGHRNFTVLNLLWKGIAAYAKAHHARYLIGCSSFTSQDPAVGAAAFLRLRPHLADPRYRTEPHVEFACPLAPAAAPPKLPRLLSTYLALGAHICGPPAIDRAFKTIDFLTLIDLRSPEVVRALQASGRYGAGAA